MGLSTTAARTDAGEFVLDRVSALETAVDGFSATDEPSPTDDSSTTDTPAEVLIADHQALTTTRSG